MGSCGPLAVVLIAGESALDGGVEKELTKDWSQVEGDIGASGNYINREASIDADHLFGPGTMHYFNGTLKTEDRPRNLCTPMRYGGKIGNIL